MQNLGPSIEACQGVTKLAHGAFGESIASMRSADPSWWLPFGLLVATVVAVPTLILDDEGLPRYRALQEELAEVRARNDVLRDEVTKLQSQVQALKTDSQAVERIARDELSMVRPGELVFHFSELE